MTLRGRRVDIPEDIDLGALEPASFGRHDVLAHTGGAWNAQARDRMAAPLDVGGSAALAAAPPAAALPSGLSEVLPGGEEAASLRERVKQLEEAHSSLEEEYAELSCAMEALGEQKVAMAAAHREALEEAVQGKAAAESQVEVLTEGKAQLEASKQELEESIRKLEASKRELEEAKRELEASNRARVAECTEVQAARHPLCKEPEAVLSDSNKILEAEESGDVAPPQSSTALLTEAPAPEAEAAPAEPSAFWPIFL